MGRLVEPRARPVLELEAASTATAVAGDDFATRVAKYVPAEVVAAYVSLGGMVTALEAGGTREVLGWVVFGACLVVTPFYLARMAAPGQPRRLHIMISIVAFVLWAYAVGGPFAGKAWHNQAIGSILLGLFTLVSGLFQPRAGDR